MRYQTSLWYFQCLLGLVGCEPFLQQSFSDGAYTRILGNTFGILGQDAEFDYVVCEFTPLPNSFLTYSRLSVAVLLALRWPRGLLKTITLLPL